VTYTVYLGASSPPTTTLTCGDVYSTTCDPGTLGYDTHYYWHVVANGLNGPSDGPVWDFTTEPCPDLPTTPYAPSPAYGATDVSVNADLSWSGGHPCPGEAVTYTVYFDTFDPPITTLTCGDVYSTTCDPGTLDYETHYYWQVVANGLNGPSDGPVWDFTTGPCTDPPATPYAPSPAYDATEVSINADLRWSGGHPCPGEAVTYTVYFGTSSPRDDHADLRRCVQHHLRSGDTGLRHPLLLAGGGQWAQRPQRRPCLGLHHRTLPRPAHCPLCPIACR